MQTRIKEFRKLRGMTLRELGDKVKTTPQTVQRLESGNMTVSMAWLEKIARALQVDESDLVGSKADQISLLGSVSHSGKVEAEDQTTFRLELPGDDRIAVRVIGQVGFFRPNTMLLANRYRPDDIINAHGQICIVALPKDNSVFLRKLISVSDGLWTLVPLGESVADILQNQRILWAAKITMAIQTF